MWEGEIRQTQWTWVAHGGHGGNVGDMGEMWGTQEMQVAHRECRGDGLMEATVA